LDEKHCNVNLLHESLCQHVPSGEDHETTNDLYADLSEAEVAAKLRSAANTSPGADRVEYAHLFHGLILLVRSFLSSLTVV
jgi:hypothetical protein